MQALTATRRALMCLFALVVLGSGLEAATQTAAFASTWVVQPSLNVGASDNYLRGVAATSGTDAWAVGWYGTNTPLRTLIEHWDGVGWKVAPSPNPGTYINDLQGVAATSTADAWAVGYSHSGGKQTLIDPFEGRVYIYRPGQAAECLENPTTVSGDPVLSGFVFNVAELW